MKRHLLAIFSFLLLFVGCMDEDKYDDTIQGNFEALWTIMDNRYCFFDYKDVNWNEVYVKYSKRIDERMGRDAFFDLMGEMLAEVKDGHVNLVASHDVARYWDWYTQYPDNFDEKIQRNYIGNDYGIASGLKYIILDNNIGYIHYESFSDALGSGNLNQVLYRMASCDGIILDVRNNGGGFLNNSEKLAARFMKEKTLVGYIVHKTGKGHNDFSKPYPMYVSPEGILYSKKVVVLTNRRCYSAANDFVNAMSYAPNVIIMGDKTGGGSGLPFSSEIPNGWSVRLSASPILNAEKQQIEFGIEPDVWVGMTEEDMAKGLDTMIEEAKRRIISDKIALE